MATTFTQWIDGQSTEAQGPLQIFLNPWNQEPLAQWKKAEEMDVVRCLAPAKKFLTRPKGWPREERVELLTRIQQTLEKNQTEWASEEALYQGLPEDFVLQNSFRHGLFLIEKNLRDLQGSQKILTAPTGVVAVITSWSLSFRLVMESLVPALAAGNAVIVKVSSRSPITAEILQRLAVESEIPAGSLQILLGEGPRVGAFLASHPGVRAVSFVGKSTTAEFLIKSATSQFKKWRVRGSTKNVALVLPGWSEDMIPEILNSFLMGQGQMGWNMSRLLTTEGEAPALLEKLKAGLGNVVSTPYDFKKILKPLELARREHARPLSGSEGPVFLVDLPNCSELQQEELLAPLFPVVQVKYLHELAKWANNTSYGSLATLWGDPEKAQKLLDKLDFGGLWINHWMRAQDESPWGLKHSGFGIPDPLASGGFFSDQKLTV